MTYGNEDVNAFCICRSDRLAGVFDAMSSHVQELRDRYPRRSCSPPVDRRKATTTSPNFSRKILRRDGECLVCHSTDRLHAHHILPRSTHPHLAKDTSNGITLCSRCHGSVKGRELQYADALSEILRQTHTTAEA